MLIIDFASLRAIVCSALMRRGPNVGAISSLYGHRGKEDIDCRLLRQDLSARRFRKLDFDQSTRRAPTSGGPAEPQMTRMIEVAAQAPARLDRGEQPVAASLLTFLL